MDRKRAFLYSSYGCWYGKCTFCSIAAMLRNYDHIRWTCRSIKEVVFEMTLLHSLGVTTIHFLDDEFIGPGHTGMIRAHEFAEALLVSQLHMTFTISCRADTINEDTFALLKDAGLSCVFIGVESGSSSALRRYNKGVTIERISESIRILRKLKIQFRCNFIIANPYSTIDEIDESLQYIDQMSLLSNMNTYGVGSVFHILHLHPGTELYDQVATVEDRKSGLEIECSFFHHNVQAFYKIAMEINKRLESCCQNLNSHNITILTALGYQSYMKVVAFYTLKAILKLLKALDQVDFEQELQHKLEHLWKLEKKYKERMRGEKDE